jgi:hypothetical protein
MITHPVNRVSDSAVSTEPSPGFPSLCCPEMLFPAPAKSMCDAIVVIPARNEAATIARTLTSLVHQRDSNGAPLDQRRYEVLLLVNNTTDHSVAIARQISKAHPGFQLHIAEVDLPEPHAHVGQARRLLMDTAAQRFRTLGKPAGVIATTDADTILEPTWVSATLEAVAQGAEAVGGRILVAPDDLHSMDHDARSCHLRDVGYRSLISLAETVIDSPPGDPWPRHFQHFGASIAVRAETYCKAGGLPVRPSLEDVAFYDRLFGIDATIRHSPEVRVHTSARFDGRTGFGFAVQLQQWAEMRRQGEPFLVRSAADILNEFETRRQVRWHWFNRSSFGVMPSESEVRQLASDLNIGCTALHDILSSDTSFGRTWQAIQCEQQNESLREQRFPMIQIDRAIQDLRQVTGRWRTLLTASPPLKQIHPVEVVPTIREVS